MGKVKEMAREAVDESNLRMLLMQDVEAEISGLEVADAPLADLFVADS